MIGLGRAYALTFVNIAIAAQQDIFYVKPAADKICIIEAIYVSNVAIASDAGDASEELLDVEIIRVPATVTASSGGSASATGTLNPLAVNDPAAGFTGRTNDTAKATTSGTLRVLHGTAGTTGSPTSTFRHLNTGSSLRTLRRSCSG